MNVSLTPQEIAARVNALLSSPDRRVRGFANPHQIELLVPARDARFFSPQLLINVESAPNGSALVGHFQPNGNVWTMFMACYGFVALCGLTGLFVGLSQWLLDEPPWGLILPPVSAAVLVGIYLAAGVGQRLGADQIEILERALDAALAGESETVEPDGESLNPKPQA